MAFRTLFKRFSSRSALAILFVIACLPWSSLISLAQESTMSSPMVVSEAWFPGITMDTAFIQDFAVLDVAPGAGTFPHFHGGHHVVTVLDGAVTVNEDGVERVYQAGQSFIEPIEHEHQIYNDGDLPARLVATTLLGEGGEMTTVTSEEGPERPGLTVVHELAVPDLTMDGLFAMLLQVLEFGPGAGIPLHTVGGPHLVLVLEGAVTVSEDGVDTIYETGQSFTKTPGQVQELVNAGDVPARVAASWLLPIAAPTSFQP